MVAAIEINQINRWGDRWSKEEISYLRENYKKIGAEAVAQKLGRTDCSVHSRALICGIFRQRYPWTKQEIDFIQLKKSRGYSRRRTCLELKELALNKGWRIRGYDAVRAKYEELQILQDFYSKADLVELFGVAFQTVRRWCEDYKEILKPNLSGASHLIEAKNLKRFCIEYPGEIAKSNPDILWYTTLLTR